MKYAKDGYKFYSVETPSVFLEFELPERDEDFTSQDRKRLARLEDTAERHGTSIVATSYRRG